MSLYPGFNKEKETSFSTLCMAVWLDGDFFVRNMDASVELRHYMSLLQRKFFLFFTEWYSFFLLWACFFFFFFFFFYFTKHFFSALDFSVSKDFSITKELHE